MNKVVEFEARAAIERQAREWLVRMDGNAPLTEAEIEQLREWMYRSALHREELKRICRFWRQANVLTDLAVCLESATEKRSYGGGRRAAAVALTASVLLVSVILTWWYLQRVDGRLNGSYQTLIGQQQSIALSDGSSIQMNTDTQVQVDYSREARTIRLLKGEALFSVTPNPRRPFDVYAGENVVRAVGTAFAVHLDGSNVDVTVTKGVVDVAEVSHVHTVTKHKPIKGAAPSSGRARLKAGEMTRLESGSDHIEVQQLAEPVLQRKIAWREGYLAFSGESLSEVVKQVNRYSSVTIEIGDPKLAAVAIGGRFRIGDLDGVLDVLETNFGIRAHRVDEHNVTLEPANSR